VTNPALLLCATAYYLVIAMPLAETLILSIGPAISKILLKIWASNDRTASIGDSAIDVLGKVIPDLRARTEANRQLAAIGEKAAESLKFVFDTEGRRPSLRKIRTRLRHWSLKHSRSTISIPSC